MGVGGTVSGSDHRESSLACHHTTAGICHPRNLHSSTGISLTTLQNRISWVSRRLYHILISDSVDFRATLLMCAERWLSR